MFLEQVVDSLNEHLQVDQLVVEGQQDLRCVPELGDIFQKAAHSACSTEACEYAYSDRE